MAEDLLAILQARGLQTTEETGWRERGGRQFDPVGVMIHHTAGTGIRTILSGRKLENGQLLPPPLADLYIAKSGQVHIVANGRANHAGAGVSLVLDEVRRNVTPPGSIQERGLKDDKPDFVGNRFFYGIEAENARTGKDPWPEVQLDAIRRTAAALCDHHRWPAARVIAHKEWTRRVTVDRLMLGICRGGEGDAQGRFPF